MLPDSTAHCFEICHEDIEHITWTNALKDHLFFSRHDGVLNIEGDGLDVFSRSYLMASSSHAHANTTPQKDEKTICFLGHTVWMHRNI